MNVISLLGCRDAFEMKDVIFKIDHVELTLVIIKPLLHFALPLYGIPPPVSTAVIADI